MRDIRFRAWDNTHKKWLSDREDVYICADGSVYIEVIEAYEMYLKKLNNVTIVQSIGLKDRNGKPIYEGDIFRYTKHAGYLLPEFTASVIWMPDHACFGYSRQGMDVSFTEHDELVKDVLSYCEVVGNIFEHPRWST